MGKKGAGSSGKGQAKSAQEEIQPDNEGLKLTGVLSTDLALLCEQEGLPPISVKPLRPSVPTNESTTDTNERDVPSRFAVLADWEDGGDPSTLLSLHIRGWLVSERVLTILTEALTSCLQLNTLSLWNVGLTAHTLQMVTRFTVQQNISELYLDGNSLTLEPIGELIKVKTSLEMLSMKCCGLTDSFLTQLSPLLSENKSLLHLDLSCNRLADEGLCALANALRLNRSLLSIALTNNKIGDRGAAALAEILSEFPLNHDEVVMKRKIDSLHGKHEDGLFLDVGREGSPQRSPSVISIDRRGVKTTGDKGVKGKKDTKKEDKTSKGKKGGDAKKGGRGKESKGSKKGAEIPEESPRPETAETKSPLFEARKTGDKWYLPGNTSLVFVSLAYNNIGESGLQALLAALRYQQTALSQPSASPGPGLLKLTINHNSVPSSCPVLCELMEIVEHRDPLQQQQTDPPPEEDSLLAP